MHVRVCVCVCACMCARHAILHLRTYIHKRMTDAASEVSAVVTLCNRTDTQLTFFSIGVFIIIYMYLEMYVCTVCAYVRLGSIC